MNSHQDQESQIPSGLKPAELSAMLSFPDYLMVYNTLIKILDNYKQEAEKSGGKVFSLNNEDQKLRLFNVLQVLSALKFTEEPGAVIRLFDQVITRLKNAKNEEPRIRNDGSPEPRTDNFEEIVLASAVTALKITCEHDKGQAIWASDFVNILSQIAKDLGGRNFLGIYHIKELNNLERNHLRYLGLNTPDVTIDIPSDPVKAKERLDKVFMFIDKDAKETLLLREAGDEASKAVHSALPAKPSPSLENARFSNFKKAYMKQYTGEFFKNPWSEMKEKLASNEVKTMKDVEDYAKAHPQSRTAKILRKGSF